MEVQKCGVGMAQPVGLGVVWRQSREVQPGADLCASPREQPVGFSEMDEKPLGALCGKI